MIEIIVELNDTGSDMKMDEHGSLKYIYTVDGKEMQVSTRMLSLRLTEKDVFTIDEFIDKLSELSGTVNIKNISVCSNIHHHNEQEEKYK